MFQLLLYRRQQTVSAGTCSYLQYKFYYYYYYYKICRYCILSVSNCRIMLSVFPRWRFRGDNWAKERKKISLVCLLVLNILQLHLRACAHSCACVLYIFVHLCIVTRNLLALPSPPRRPATPRRRGKNT